MTNRVTLAALCAVDSTASEEAGPVEFAVERKEGRLTLTLLNGEQPTAARIVLENYGGKPVAYIWDGSGSDDNHAPPYTQRIELVFPTSPEAESRQEEGETVCVNAE